MTDAALPAPSARPAAQSAPPRRPGGGNAAALSWLGAVAAFAVLLLLLGWQLATGRDHAIGAQTPAVSTTEPRRVLVRRIERKIVITRVLPAARSRAVAGTGAGVAAPSGGVAMASPRAAAPPPAQAAAPAPAPAPLTRSS